MMIQYLCAKAFIDSRQDQMYKSLGIDTTRTQEYSEEQLAKKAWHLRYAACIGAFLVRTGEKLLKSTRQSHKLPQELMS